MSLIRNAIIHTKTEESLLVSWWFQPIFKKYARQIGISPNRGENKKSFEITT